MKLKKILIFISDEGYGHTVRQRALIKSILKEPYKEIATINTIDYQIKLKRDDQLHLC